MNRYSIPWSFIYQGDHHHGERFGGTGDHPGSSTGDRRDESDDEGRVETDEGANPGYEGEGDCLGDKCQRNSETGQDLGADAGRK